jgi:hypothetical protein
MNGRASQLAMAPRSNRDELHSLEGSTPSPSAENNVLLAERQRLQASNLARRVRLSQSTLQIDWVGSSAAEQVPVKYQRAGSSPARPSVKRCGVVAAGSDAWL